MEESYAYLVGGCVKTFEWLVFVLFVFSMQSVFYVFVTHFYAKLCKAMHFSHLLRGICQQRSWGARLADGRAGPSPRTWQQKQKQREEKDCLP